MLAKKVNDLCIACHAAQKDGRHVTPLVPSGHEVGGDLNDPRRQGRDFSCASCHDPHGSNSPRLFYYGESTMQSCDWCHGDKSGKNPEMKKVISKAKRTAPKLGAGGAGGGSGSGSGSGDLQTSPSTP
jgi:predicted CXXCH cytochrome family protein